MHIAITSQLINDVQNLCDDKVLILHLQRRLGQTLDNIAPQYLYKLIIELRLNINPIVIDNFCAYMPEETLEMLADKLQPSQITYCIQYNSLKAISLFESGHFCEKFSPATEELIREALNRLNLV